MSVLKYLDPVTGEWKRSNTVKVVNGGAPEQLTASGYPDYLQPEVLEMVGKINAVRKQDSIVFIAMADSHYVADQDLNFYDEETNASTVQANQAAKVLSYLVKPDFFAHLGDVSCGAASTPPEMLKKQIEGCVSYVREAASDLPVFIAIGNHDAGIYYHDAQTDGAIHTMTGEYLYKNFTALSASDNTVFGGEESGGYCYRDFPEKKLRVIMLNTSEKLVTRQIDNTTHGAQRVWLANALLDLNTKADAAKWGFIILSHYPADYGAAKTVSHLLNAYVEGESIRITDPADSDYYQGDGTDETVDFTGRNAAKFIAQFHGHIHNFLTSKLYDDRSGSPVTYDGWRVSIPNGQYNRENSYTSPIGGVNFAEATVYRKTAGTASGTSFVVNVINPSEEAIYSICYGAGYDRVVGYAGTIHHAIMRTLRNVTTDTMTVAVKDGASHTEILTPIEDYEMGSLTVTMGGVDITAAAVTIVDGSYRVHIPQVTGEVSIDAKGNYILNGTNQLPISTDAEGNIYNGVGYKADTVLSGGGEEKERTGVYISGFIPCKGGDTVYFKNCTLVDGDSNSRFTFFDASKTQVGSAHFNMTNETETHATFTYYEDGNLAAMTILATTSYGKQTEYIRFCCAYLGEDSIVTVNEPIE